MTHLNIQQGLNIEVVSTNLIKKLYEAALSVPEPLEGELDAAYMSGNLLVDKTYRALVEYLTNRFDDLHINVTGSYYIPFEDSSVLNVLLANNIGSDGIGVTEAEAANATFTTSTFLNNTDITSFNTFNYFTRANNNPPYDLFRGCTNLTSVNTSNITTLMASEFQDSGLTGELSMPNLTGTIPELCFKSCRNITSITNLGHITGISPNARGSGYFDGAFQECTSLVSVTIPSTVTAISAGFLSCINLTTINGNTENITTLGTCAFHKTKIPSIPNMPNLLQIGDACFSYNTSLTGIINFPYVTTIGSEAFKSCPNITGALNLPSLISLGQYAFYQTGITSITDLGSITSVPDMCFNNCNSLATVTLPSTCTRIKSGAFAYDTALTSIDLGGTTTIDNQAFIADSNLTTVTGMSNLTVIGNNAFLNCPITGTLNLPNLTSLGNFAFLNCKFSTILSLGTISSLAEGMFGSMTNLTSVTLPSTLRTISWGTFNGSTSLTKLIIPEGVTSIINQQPNLMTGLIYIEVPSTVTDMLKCFHRFLEQNLNESVFMVIKAENPPALAFYNLSDTAGNNMYNTNPLYGIYVPNVTTYQNASGPWQSLKILSKLKPISQLQTDNPTLWADYLSRINQS